MDGQALVVRGVHQAAVPAVSGSVLLALLVREPVCGVLLSTVAEQAALSARLAADRTGDFWSLLLAHVPSPGALAGGSAQNVARMRLVLAHPQKDGGPKLIPGPTTERFSYLIYKYRSILADWAGRAAGEQLTRWLLLPVATMEMWPG